MRDARLTIPTAALLLKAVDGLDAVEMVDRDTKGDAYEYMLSKIATAGQNGQFRTPRRIIELMSRGNALWPKTPSHGTCRRHSSARRVISRLTNSLTVSSCARARLRSTSNALTSTSPVHDRSRRRI